MRGYFGTFLSFDLMMGLNAQYFGKPGWLVFFSLVAAHSDLLLFIKEEGQDLSPAQYEEARFTPDRIPKKIVEFKAGELKWVPRAKEERDLRVVYVGKGINSQEGWLNMEREFAEPLIEAYARDYIPNDRLFVLREDETVSEYPLRNLC